MELTMHTSASKQDGTHTGQIDNNIDIWEITGTVLDIREARSQSVTTSTSGGGGSLHNGTGTVAPVTSSTTVTENINTSIFLRLENDTECTVNVFGTTNFLRPDSTCQVFLAQKDNAPSTVIQIVNTDTSERFKYKENMPYNSWERTKRHVPIAAAITLGLAFLFMMLIGIPAHKLVEFWFFVIFLSLGAVIGYFTAKSAAHNAYWTAVNNLIDSR